MLTQCPHCKTIFRVTAAHLNIAQGHVRCSHCRHIFNAINSLVKTVTKDKVTEEKPVPPDSSTEFNEFDIPELLQEDVYEPQKRSWKAFLFWSLMALILSAVLAGQVMWFWQRDTVLQHAEVRPWLERFCRIFLCRLPPTRNLASFEMQEHVTQIDSEQPSTIQFQATFVNNASFPQPYPNLQLIFEDLDGNQMVRRLFTPKDYLPKPLKPYEQMPAKAAIHLKLELKDMAQIIDEGKIAESYRFEFL
jgi:predicted Zn finger-like uncharacterized protein